MPIGRAPLTLALVLAAMLCACPSATKQPEAGNGNGEAEAAASPEEKTEPEGGGQAVAVYEGEDFTVYAPDTGTFFEDLQIFFGGDRPPRRALKKIGDTHNLKTWAYRLDVEDAVSTTREAVEELTRSDYLSWDETSNVVTVLSAMAIRDPASVVRTDCLSSLSWFRTWIREDLIRLDPAPDATEDEMVAALKRLDGLKGDAKSVSNPEVARSAAEAIDTLGRFPWDEVPAERAAIIRSALSRPRGLIRYLTRQDITKLRGNAKVSTALDTALIRLDDQVIIMTMMAGLADPTPYVRAGASKALFEARDVRAVGPIIAALETETRDIVTQELVRALGRCAMGDTRKKAIPALAELLMHTDVTVRQAAAREMERLTGAGLDVDPSAWLRWWREHAKEYGRR